MVSIIVPVYKVEKYLPRCIDSILSQTYKDFELILVDDGSPDKSGVICDEYAERDNRIKVIHQKNRGQAAARNNGINVSKGDYISFIDSDDRVSFNYLETLLSLISNGENDLAICSHINEHEGIKPVESHEDDCRIETLTKSEIIEEVFGKLNNAVWNKLYKRELLNGIVFPEDVIHGEDLIFNLQYAEKCNKVAKSQKTCYYYLQRSDSVTGSSFSEKKFLEIVSKDRALEIIENNSPEQINNARKYCFRARMNVLRSAHKAKKQNEYAEQIIELERYVKTNYKAVKSYIRLKEKIEYKLYFNVRFLYKLIIRFV